MEKTTNKIIVQTFKTRDEMGKQAAADVAQTISKLLTIQEEVNMIFASAPSQSDFLNALLTHKEIDWSRINAFHMDEYIGLGLTDGSSLSCYLRQTFLNHIQTKMNFFIDGTKNPLEECVRYQSLIEEHPIDIVCMGIGENGHIAFNEPHVADFNDPLKIKIIDLDDTSIMQQVNDGTFSTVEKVPRKGITLTIPTLTSGKYTFCIVPTSNKAEAVRKTLKGEINSNTPASILRTLDRVNLYLDEEAASLI